MMNIDRSVVAEPNIGASYRTPEILDALGVVFRNKCYLCERSHPNPDDFEVEHFYTQKERPDLKRQWTNLFLACRNCNGIKPRNTPEGGYLNPCEDDIESIIVHELPHYDYDSPEFYAKNDTEDIRVQNTINLLKRLHFGHEPRTTRSTASLREAISKQARILLTLIIEHHKAEKNGEQSEQARFLQKIQKLLSRNAPFTMLMRHIGVEHGYSEYFD